MAMVFKEELSSAPAEMKTVFKKIKASDGKLTGNFYIAALKGGDYAFCVTLSARDPKGNTVASKGKAARKGIKGCKFGRGLIEWDSTKKGFAFRLYNGSIPKGLLKEAVTREMAKNVAGMSFLKSAQFLSASSSPEDVDEDPSSAPDTSSEPVEELDTSDLDESEVASLIALQPDLSEKNNSLNQFLSDQETAIELAEQLSELTASYEEAVKSGDPVEIEKNRTALLEAQSSGADYFKTHEMPGLTPVVLQAAMARSESGDRKRLFQQWLALGEQANRLQERIRSVSSAKDVAAIRTESASLMKLAVKIDRQMKAFD